MQVCKLLHELSHKALGTIHLTRQRTVWLATEGVLRGQRLALTHIGRSLPGSVSEKHAIKRVDRLLGNPHLASERTRWYRWLSQLLINGRIHPVVLVDWSALDERRELFVLRAALAIHGRAIPLYEEVHRGNGADVEERFVRNLARILPADCVPILVSDAGFRPPWFTAVRSLGWYFVGRVRGCYTLSQKQNGPWVAHATLHCEASGKAKSLGRYWLARSNPTLVSLVVYKASAKGRVTKTKTGARPDSGKERRHAKGAKEPWLLAHNLPARLGSPRQLVNIYRTRMQIEECFRDTKSVRYGLSLRHNMGRNAQRVANLLLLGALAILVQWIIGKYAELNQLHRQLQANTVSTRRVLSTIYLGARLIAKNVAIRAQDLRLALGAVQAQAVGVAP